MPPESPPSPSSPPLSESLLSRESLSTLLQATSLPWFVPHKPWPKQQAFLLLPHREAFYGGAAGPGKSDALLMGAMQFAEHPAYRALLMRRSYADLARSGALMDRAHDWLAGTGSVWDPREHTWYFPSGARLSFGYCENVGDEERQQGTNYHYIGIDELTQWVERQYRYMFSRLRRLAGEEIPLRMRAASNPGSRGHAWVKARFIDVPNGTIPDRATIRALIADNPSLDLKEYLQSLELLDPVTRARLMNGNWDVRSEGGIFSRAWFRHQTPAPEWSPRIRYWDMAATAGGGDGTAGVRMAVHPEAGYVVEHLVLGHWGPGERDKIIEQTAEADPVGTVLGWEEEGGSSGKSVSAGFAMRFRGRTIYADHKTGKKVVRWGPLASQAQMGNVGIVSGGWNAPFLDELCGVVDPDSDEEGGPDDVADAAAGAYLWLALQPVVGPPLVDDPGRQAQEDYERERGDQGPEAWDPFARARPRPRS